jgi:ubiquinol-cytochrome c reductase cytochrome b subunit
MLPTRASRWLRGTLVLTGVVAWSVLTGRAMWRDHNDPRIQREAVATRAYAVRARELADGLSIPPEGAATLLQNDARTQGPRLFKQHCVSCHPYTTDSVELVGDDDPSAADLGGLGTHDWIAGFLDPERITSAEYFGNTEHAEGEMMTFVTDEMDLDDESLEQVLAALTTEAALPGHEPDAEAVEMGRGLISGDAGCVECHKFHDDGDIGTAPDLTGYGSRDWLVGFISNPSHDRFYGEYNDRMPSYDPEAETAVMSERQLDMLVDWLRGEWYRPGETPHLGEEHDMSYEPVPSDEPEPETSDEPKSSDEPAPSDAPETSDEAASP